MCSKLLQSCPTLWNPMDRSRPGSSDHRILQARILEWVPVPPPGDFPDPGIKSTSLIMSSALAGRFFTTWRHLGSPQYRNMRSQRSTNVNPCTRFQLFTTKNSPTPPAVTGLLPSIHSLLLPKCPDFNLECHSPL